MKVTRGLHNWRDSGPCVVAIGNFDGVHVGHQELIKALHERAAEQGLPAVLMTFEPPPTVYFQQQHAPARLTTLREKLGYFAQYGVEHVLCLPFNNALASLNAIDFVQHILVDCLSVHTIIIGDDFHFGYQRRGNATLLRDLGEKHGFSVHQMDPCLLNKQRVSSSHIRTLLQAGELAKAQRLLSRHYAISGRVISGDQRGRLLGFPTANIPIAESMAVLAGVYVVKVTGLEHHPLPGVANIGRRPTVGGEGRLLEVHLLDFDRAIYGKRINVEFLSKLRDEQKFASMDLLKQHIAADKAQAEQYFEMECE